MRSNNIRLPIGVAATMLLVIGALLVGDRIVPAQVAEDTAVLVGAGDIAKCNGQGDEATAALLDGIDGTVFTTGDNAYPNGSTANFTDCYEPSWGDHKARTMPSVGNHEYDTPGASGYFDYFGAKAGDPDKGYYSYDRGSWHIVVLNTNCSDVKGGCGPGSPQEIWLRDDLAANPATCTAAYFHHPRFSSGVHGDSTTVKPFWEALYDAGTDVVLSGHEHAYERFAPQDPDGRADAARGIRQFTVGTGGAEFTDFQQPKPNSQRRISNTNGVLKLTLNPEGYGWAFLKAPGGSAIDSGSDRCSGSKPDEVAPAVDNVSPVDGATGVGVDASVKATFSESMDASTITTSTFTLVERGDTTPVDAQVAYHPETRKAALNPDATLKPDTTYVATIKGGNGGAKDSAANPLAADKTWSFVTTTDMTGPVAQPPQESLEEPTVLGRSAIPIKLTWSATDNGSGVSGYKLQQSTDGGPYVDVELDSADATSTTLQLSPGKTYRFRTLAMDGAGNAGEWAYGKQFSLDAHQENSPLISYIGEWVFQVSPAAYGGERYYENSKGSTASFGFEGSSVGWVAASGPTRGMAEVWLDGTKVETVDLYSETWDPRRVVFARNDLDPSVSHTLEVRVLGERSDAGGIGRRVHVDAFVTLQQAVP